MINNVELLESGELLTETEKKLFKMLLTIAENCHPTTEIRIAGGWVRDKVLNKNPYDIDLMIHPTPIKKYALKFKERYNDKILSMKGSGLHEKVGDSNISLITIVFKDGCAIDLVNSKYKFTIDPILSDASSRDLSINAMFFNINLMKVEDYIGGMKDLENKIVRPPRDPFIAYGENQIHVVRLARFAARFGYNYPDNVRNAARLSVNDSKNKLVSSIVFMEVQKAFMGPDPLRFIEILFDFHYFDLVFGDYMWNKEDILRKVKLSVERAPEKKQKELIANTLVFYLLEKGTALTHQHMNKIMCGCTNKQIASSALQIKTLINNLNRVSVGNWIIKCGEEWKLSFELLEDEEIYQFAHHILLSYIISSNLEEAYKIKPLVNGKELMTMCKKNSGKWIKNSFEKIINLQLEHPNISKDIIIDYIKANISLFEES